MSEPDYKWTVRGTRIPGSPFFDDIKSPFWMIEFSDWEDMRENMGCIMEQLLMEQVFR